MELPPDNDNAPIDPDDVTPADLASGEVVAIAPVIALRMEARSLYWRGWSLTQIAGELGIAYSTVSSWKVRHRWDDAPAITRAEEGTLERYLQLVGKEKKTGSDFKEIDLLARQFERLARVGKFQNGGNEADLNPRVKKRNSPEVLARKDAAKNLITPEMVDKLRADLDDKLFRFQRDWLASTNLRTRMIIKSRQIGATWYFARERLLRALETGHNQIFLSASKAQAHIFRNYIVQWVQLVCGFTLKGDPMVIQRGAASKPDNGDEGDEEETLEPVTLLFLGTNYRTAQGYSGDVIIDEFMWIYGFEQLFDVAAAMATHKQFTRTLFSTPSTMDHEAYRMWSGEKYNKSRKKVDWIKVDIAHGALKDGAMGGDRIWRQIVSVFDAIDKGMDRIDVEELQAENSVEVFDNLYRCNFLDDSQSMFPFALMRRCMVDSWEVWKKDFEPYDMRPFGDGEVWLGYDPNASESETADEAALVVIAPPAKPGGKFRVLEKKRMKGLDFAGQAEAIREVCERYRVTRIGIDTSGAGRAVFELVSAWFPTAEPYNYSVQTKVALVLKAKNVIAAGRLEFDAGWLDVASAFMAIRPEMTKQGPTYVASRGGGVGHADLAWAICHALFFEPLDITKPAGGGSAMEFF